MALLRCLVLPLLLLLSACESETPSRVETPADTSEQTIPFELAGRGEAALVVPVHINGQGPFDFVLDTGATLTCVNEPLVADLNLPERSGRSGIASGLAGSGQVQLVKIDSLRIGEVQAMDLTACAISLESLQQADLEVQGLLGLNFLKSFRMTLDFERETLRLEQ